MNCDYHYAYIYHNYNIVSCSKSTIDKYDSVSAFSFKKYLRYLNLNELLFTLTFIIDNETPSGANWERASRASICPIWGSYQAPTSSRA